MMLDATPASLGAGARRNSRRAVTRDRARLAFSFRHAHTFAQRPQLPNRRYHTEPPRTMTSPEHQAAVRKNAGAPDFEAQIKAARALQDQHEFMSAEAAYRELVFSGLPGATAWLGLGQCVRTRGDRRLALTYFLAGHAAEPSNPWPILEAAGEFLILGQVERASAAYAKGLGIAPQNVEAHLGLGRCLRRSGQAEAALAHFRAAAEQAPDRPAPLMELAATLDELGRWDEADAAYRAASRDGQLPADVSMVRGRQARERNDRKTALLCFEAAATAAPRNHWAHLEAACELLALGHPKEALTSYVCGATLAPDNADAQLGIGLCQRLLGNRGAALQSFRKAAALAPENPRAQLELATELRDGGEFAPALEAAQKALALQPEHPDALVSIALTERAAGEPERALATLRGVPVTGPERLHILLELAAEEQRLGLLPAYEEHLAQARGMAPDHPALLQHLAGQAMLAGKPAKARALYQQAVVAAPEDLTPRLGLLDATAAAGQPEEALALAQHFQAAFGEQPILLAKMIFLKRLAGDYHASLALARSAAAAFPHYFWICSERFQTELLISDAGAVEQCLQLMPAYGPRETALRLGFSAALCEREMALEEAASLYRQAAQLSPDDPQLHWNLVRVAMLLLELPEAGQHLRRFSDLSKSALGLQRKSTNISQTHYGQILDDYRLDADVIARLRPLQALPPEARSLALARFTAEVPDSIAAAVSLMVSLHHQRLIGQPVIGGPNAIPKAIMQYWDMAEVPADVEALMRSWRQLHPGVSILLHNDTTARDFLAAEFPPGVLQAYVRAVEPAQKADIFRLAWLERHGGIYVDADNRCLQPVSTLLPAGATLVLYQEDLGTVANDFIAVVPGHPVISWALATAVTTLNRGDTDLVWLATGPGLMTRAVAQAVAAASSTAAAVPPGLYVHSRQAMLNVMARNCMVAYRATTRNWVLSAFHANEAEDPAPDDSPQAA